MHQESSEIKQPWKSSNAQIIARPRGFQHGQGCKRIRSFAACPQMLFLQPHEALLPQSPATIQRILPSPSPFMLPYPYAYHFPVMLCRHEITLRRSCMFLEGHIGRHFTLGRGIRVKCSRLVDRQALGGRGVHESRNT